MKPTPEQVLSALNKLIKENKTELKAEKVELGIADDVSKARKKLEQVIKESEFSLKESKNILNTLGGVDVVVSTMKIDIERDKMKLLKDSSLLDNLEENEKQYEDNKEVIENIEQL